MRYIILLTSVFALSFSGAYLSYDLTSNFEVSSDGFSYDEDFDSGALAVGYVHDLQNNMSVGASLDLLNMEMEDSDDGIGFLNIFGRYSYPLSEKVSLWGSVGYNLPQGDIDDSDAGLSYGFGAQMSNGVGFNYTFHNFSEDEFDGTVSRLTLSYSF